MNPTPQPLLEILNAISEQTARLTAAAKLLNVTRNFTLDGRLVGDIGEMLAAQHLELTLDGSQRKGHDAVTVIDGVERNVQVKCRKSSQRIAFGSVPDLLVVITFSEGWKEWEFTYNGDGSPVRDRAVSEGCIVDVEGQIWKEARRETAKISLSQLRKSACSKSAVVPERPVKLKLFV